MPPIAPNSEGQKGHLRPDLKERAGSASKTVLVILSLFVVAGIFQFWSSSGDDLSSSYIGCRLLANGQADHLFAYDKETFSMVGPDAAWKSTARTGGFTGYVHPYVQIPLWAKVLQPICTRTSFRQFNGIFAVLTMLSFAGTLWLTARYWTPHLSNGVAMGAIVLLLWASVPFQYAMMLMQTHILFVLMVIAALILVERGWPVAGGALAACAAAVKITPGFLLLYWVLTRRSKAAASLGAGLIVLWGASLALTGTTVMQTYRANLQRVSHVLLLSQNNQSFAAWTMGRFYPPDEIFDSTIYTLPATVRWSSMGLLVACVVIGGRLDRRWQTSRGLRGKDVNPLGAMMVVVGGTIFAPISWTHYSIVLLVPAMMLLEESARSGARPRARWILRCGVAAMILLNLHPLAAEVETGDVGQFALVRGHFYSGLLCLSLLAWASLERLPSGRLAVPERIVEVDLLPTTQNAS